MSGVPLLSAQSVSISQGVTQARGPRCGGVEVSPASHPVTALTLGSSYVDADPEQQEEDSKAHEEGGHQGDKELFVDIPGVLGGCDLITGRVIKEKQRGGTKNQAVKNMPMASSTTVRWGKTAGFTGLVYLLMASSS